MCPEALNPGRRIRSHRAVTSAVGDPTLCAQTRRRCRHHPQSRASWVCEGCRQHLCAECVREMALEDLTTAACRRCKARCVPFEGVDDADRRAQVDGDLVEALGYPWRGTGRVVLLSFALSLSLVSLLVLVLRVISPTPLLATGVTLAIVALGAIYLLAHLLDVLRRTLVRPEHDYDLPEMNDLWDSILFPALRVMGASLVAAVPGALIQAVAPSLAWIGGLAHAALFPAVLLAAALREEWSALAPARWLPVLRRGGAEYGRACLLFALVEGLLLCSLLLLDRLWLWGLVAAGGLYLAAVAVRVLGHLGRRLLRDGTLGV